MHQLNYAIRNYLQSILNALIEVKRIMPPESKIIVPFRTSTTVTSIFPSGYASALSISCSFQ
jgi:hypothetical protein